MSLTIETYEKGVNDLVESLNSLGDDLRSVFFYGSYARGRCRVGRSDILDLIAVVRQKALESRKRYFELLDLMCSTLADVGAAGLPVPHGYQYIGDEESRYLLAFFTPILASDEESICREGEDLRGWFADPVPTGTGYHDTMHGSTNMIVALLAGTDPTEQQIRDAIHWMNFLRKCCPTWACLAVGEPAAGAEAIETIQRLFPDVDLSVLDDLETLHDHEDESPDTEELRDLARRCFLLVEQLHETIDEKGSPLLPTTPRYRSPSGGP